MMQKWCDRLVDDGFSLIEVAIALTVMGIIAGIAVPSLTHVLHMGKTRVTALHQEAVLTALSHYALRSGYLPLPAVADGHGIAPEQSTNVSERDLVGYVPYVTLGISSQYALDGFQQPMIYAVTLMHDDDYYKNVAPEPRMSNPNTASSSNFNFQQPTEIPGPKLFCHKHADPIAKLDIFDHNESPVFIEDAVKPDDFLAVALLSRGEEAISPHSSETERINAVSSLQFYDHPYSTRQDTPHRHRLKWVSRDFLIGHYGQVSCPALRDSTSSRYDPK